MYQEKDPSPEQLVLREYIRAEYPHLIERPTLEKKISNMALGSKNIKRLLAHEFPGVKFKAKSLGFAGGSSIDVRWEDCGEGPSVKEVEALIESNFAYRSNGTAGGTNYDRDPWRVEFRHMFGSASYVHSQSSKVSPEELARRSAVKLQSKTAPIPQSRPRRSL